MKYTINKPLSKLYPSTWSDSLDMSNTHIAEYANLAYFRHHVKTLRQKEDDKCGVPYLEALDGLLRNKATMSSGDYEIIKNNVKNSLLKRGLISENIYESYKYDVDGSIFDVAKVIAEDPECFLVPNATYVNYFYELYISVSYPWSTSDETIRHNMAKILATVELLEREHIFCKITLVMPNRGCNTGSGKSNHLILIPLFSHKDPKDITTMSAVLNERLLRKFIFAIIEDQYGSDLASDYGQPVSLPSTINPGDDLDECDLCSSILDQVITPGTR